MIPPRPPATTLVSPKVPFSFFKKPSVVPGVTTSAKPGLFSNLFKRPIKPAAPVTTVVPIVAPAVTPSSLAAVAPSLTVAPSLAAVAPVVPVAPISAVSATDNTMLASNLLSSVLPTPAQNVQPDESNVTGGLAASLTGMTTLVPAAPTAPASQQPRQPGLFSNLFQSVKTNVGNELKSQIDQAGRDIKGHALGLVDEAKGQALGLVDEAKGHALGLLTDAKNRAIQQAQMALTRSIPGLTPAQAQQLQSKLQTVLPEAISEGLAPAEAIVAAKAAVLQDAVDTGVVTANQASVAAQSIAEDVNNMTANIQPATIQNRRSRTNININLPPQTTPPPLPPRDDIELGAEFQCVPFVLPSNPSDGAICRSKGFDGYRDATGKCDNDPNHHTNCTMLGCTGWHPGKGNCFIAPGVTPTLAPPGTTDGVQSGGEKYGRRISFGGDSPVRTLRQCINF